MLRSAAALLCLLALVYGHKLYCPIGTLYGYLPGTQQLIAPAVLCNDGVTRCYRNRYEKLNAKGSYLTLVYGCDDNNECMTKNIGEGCIDTTKAELYEQKDLLSSSFCCLKDGNFL